MAGDGGLLKASSDKEQQASKESQQQAKERSQEKPVKVLPCPRCESMNTKFCYYNNYSMTQPRHFCRQCQRYWTAGGTLRNVPVGGGSRKKNRHSAHHRPLTSSEPYLLNHRFAHPPPPPPGHFQQMLTSQDMLHLQYNPSSGYAPPPPLLPHAEPVLYGTGVGFFPSPETTPGFVKSEFIQWPPQQQGTSSQGTSSMLLNLGLNSHRKVAWEGDQELKPQQQRHGGSPQHGGSTIEEEGSTPTNGYSNNGYHDQEETAVSSMWGTMNEIDTIFQ